jgi:hypothetical protein
MNNFNMVEIGLVCKRIRTHRVMKMLEKVKKDFRRSSRCGY